MEAALDYELQASYALVVRASDTAAGAGTVEVAVAVTDVTGSDDPPTPGLGEATVEAVAFATVPALDAGYRIGETVRAAVTFSKTVELVGTASEVTLALRVGNRTREAAYAGGSGTDAPGPSPTRSPRATATRTGCRCERTRSMRGSAAIEAGGEAAVLDHAALADDGAQKVDGERPAFVSAAAGEDTGAGSAGPGLRVVAASFDEALRSTAFGDAEKYRVSDSLDRTLPIASVRLSGADAEVVEIVLAAPLAPGSTVNLTYNALAGSFAFTQATDAVGNTAASFGPVAVDTGTAPSDDATLEVFRIKRNNTVQNLTPAFDPMVSAYRRELGNGVDEVTLEVRASDANAAVAIAGDDDPATPGEAAIALAEGANTVTATVTAEDGVTMRSYTALVARAAAAPAADAGALWTARMTVGQSATGRGYDTGTIGSMAPDRFDHAGGVTVVSFLAYTAGEYRLGTAWRSGGAPLEGSYRLEVGGRSFDLAGDGVAQEFTFAAADPGWNFGEVVDVKLVPVDTPPAFTGTAISIAENSFWGPDLDTLAGDAEGDSLTFSIVGGADAELFQIAGGVLGFKAAPDFEMPRDVASTDPANAAGNNLYLVRVRASDGGSSAEATIRVRVTDEADTAGAIGTLALSQGGATSMHLYWSEAARAGGPAITGYDVQYKRNTVSAWSTKSHSGTGITTTITGLTAGNTYDYRVRGKNGEGDGPWKTATEFQRGKSGATNVNLSADQSGVEGDTITMTVTVANHPGTASLGYQVRLLPGTASPSDYSRNGNGQVNFPSGSTGMRTKTVTIDLVDDDRAEDSEYFYVVLDADDSGQSDKIQDGLARITINVGSSNRDRTVVEVTPGSRTVSESAGSVSFDVAIDSFPPQSGQTTVDWRTVAGTATAGTDFTASSGTLRVPGTITVAIENDDFFEQAEAFTIEIDNATNDGISLQPKIAGDSDNDGEIARTVTIGQHDLLSFIRVSVDPAEVTVGESAAATCTLMGGGVFEADQTVKVVDGDGTVLQTATLPAGERTVTVALDTATAGAFEIGGRIDLPSALGGGNLTSGIVAFTVLDPAAKRVLVSTDELEIAEGFSGTYTVVLSRAPAADVTVAVAQTVATYLNGNLIVGPSPIAGIEFEPATLTFTAENWDTPQTVTVSGLQDANDEPASALFTHTPSGGGYDGAETGDVFVLVNDDENPATPSPASVLVSQADLRIDEGGSGTYTVVLGHAPTADVTVAIGTRLVSQSFSTNFTVDSSSLTFTVDDWDTPQTVTVSAPEDPDIGSEAAYLTHTPSGGGYDAVLGEEVLVLVADDEGFSSEVRLSVEPASVPEGAGPTPVTVTGTVDAAARDNDIDVTVSVGAGKVQPVADLTFTIPAGSRTGSGQITVTPVDDAVDGPDETVALSGTATVPPGAIGLSVKRTALTIADDDTLGLVIAPATLALTEGGVAAAYTLRLATPPTADVTVTPVSSGAELEFTPAELTFTPASWETPQSMAVSAVDDGDVLPGTASVSHTTAGGDYAGGSFPDGVAVSVDDDDMPGVTVSPQALVIGEGKSDAYTVVLRTEPPGDVTITPAVPAGTDVIVRPQRLVFAPGNWEVAQSFTVEALADDDAAPEAAVTVAHAASGGGYDTVAVAPVTVEVAEDDAVGVVVAPLTIEVPEGGPGKTYTVVLTSAPTAPVTVTPAGLARADAKVTVTPASVTFDATHWSTPKPFMVEAADDADSDDALERIPHDVAGGDYQGAAADTVTATVKDDEVASAEVALSVDPARVDEGTGLGGGVSVTVTATLDRAPRASPTEVTVSVGAGTGASAAEASDFEAVADFTLTIPADTLSGTQTFTLATTSDDVDEGDETLAVTGMTTVPGLAVTGAVLTIVELSTRGIFASADAVTVAEGDTVGATYGVSLETEPTGTVTVRAVPEAGTDVRVAPATLAFTAGDWEEPQYFAVTAVDDADSATDVVATITHRASGGGYDGLAGEAPVAVTIVETDVPGVRVTRPTAPELFEGESYTYTVVLQTRPAGDVTVTPQVPAGAEIAIAPAAAVFEPDEWDRPRTFTIRVAEDDDGIHDGRVAIGHGVTGPGAYATVTVSPLLVTLSDDDLVLVAVSPGSSGLEVTENGAEAFLVMLGSQPTATVTVSASESSAAIAIPNATLTFTRSSWNVAQPLTVSALDDSDSDDEEATVTFTAAGGDYANAVLQTRTVTVKDDDVASTAVRLSVAPSIVDEDDGSVTITVTGTLNGMTRSGATDIALSVAGVTATAGDDYTFGYSGDFRIRISGGQMSGTKTFTLSPVDDDLYEEAEYLNVTGSHGTLDVAAHDLLIYDNDTRGIVLSSDRGDGDRGRRGRRDLHGGAHERAGRGQRDRDPGARCVDGRAGLARDAHLHRRRLGYAEDGDGHGRP